MKDWSFKIEKRPDNITEKLESELTSIGGFVFDKKNPTTFSFRKRILYPWFMAFQNWTVVSGKLSSNSTENATTVKISFRQHFLIRLIISTHILLGLGFISGLLFTTIDQPSTYILGGLIIAIGILIWIAITRKFKKDAAKYKGLITETFGL